MMRSEQETLDLFRLYLNEIGRHPLLTREDEVRLSQAYAAGLDAQRKLAELDPDNPERPALERLADRGERARRRMIQSNLRLVVSVARCYPATGLPLADLVQEGNIGLLRAVEKFDWRKGLKFSTYATWWIRQAITRGAADRGTRPIRLPVHVDEQVGRLRRTQALGRAALGQAVAALPERERLVLVPRFGLDSGTPRTLEEAGAVIGVSRERTRQVERDALAALLRPDIRARLQDLDEPLEAAGVDLIAGNGPDHSPRVREHHGNGAIEALSGKEMNDGNRFEHSHGRRQRQLQHQR